MAKIPERGSTHIYKVNRISPDEIASMTNLCVSEQPPYCNAACPLKVDVRSIMDAVSKGDFKKALFIYEKVVPFPSLLSQHCEAPCQSKCKLCSFGDGIAIKDIESSLIKYGEKTVSGGVFRTHKKQTVVIFGDDLFCLFLAGELEKKMYPTTIITTANNYEDFLSPLNAIAELDHLKAMDLNFIFGQKIEKSLAENYDVVCASELAAKELYPDAKCNEAYMVYEKENIIMGHSKGVLDSAFAAKKAALSVDRLAQHLDPSNMRSDEGPVETSLFTNTENITSISRIEVVDKETAIKEAKRCLLCHCDECMKACAYLQHFQKKPSLIGKEIYNNTQIIMGTHPLNHAMNACTLCGQCKEVCPNGIDMATICQHARQNMVSTDKMPLSQHEFALLDMFFSNEDAFLSRSQPGYEKCKYVFFPGCQASAIAPSTVEATYKDLCKRVDGGVALILGCCSVLAKWSGRDEIYNQQKAFLKAELNKLGNPIIIAGCPMCKKELSEYNNNVIGIWDILLEIGLPQGKTTQNKKVALHDSCGARGDKKTQESIRALASKLGCELVDIDYSGDKSPCCGYGGLTAYANVEVAKKITDKALERSDAPFITYCMACRDRFARDGHESNHILEIVYETDAGSPPNLSEKRFNRLSLKNRLLEQIWKEKINTMPLDYNIEYTDEAIRLMDERFILKEDVEQVLTHMRETNEAVFDSESNLFISCYRPGNVTFWVKYSEKDGGYIVHRVWSHRMFIQNREDF